ncbi:MAG: type II toxin-antitoxin system antitoxin SocA domain-containing protein [Balneolales bacterium]
MKSPFTGGKAVLVREPRSLQFRGELFDIVYHLWRCEDTGKPFTTDELDRLNITQVHNQYREKHRVPFPEEIREIRSKYGVSATKMSAVMGFGVNTWRNYEQEEIPQTSNARLIRLAADPEEFTKLVNLSSDLFREKERAKLEKQIKALWEQEAHDPSKSLTVLLSDRSFWPNRFNGYRALKPEKLFHLICYFAREHRLYKTRLNKLLFYTDFLHYKLTGFSITGIVYRAIDLGPVPDRFDVLYEFGVNENYYHIDYELQTSGKNSDQDNLGERFIPNEDKVFDIDLFNDSELGVVKRISELFKFKKTKDIIDISHREKLWLELHEGRALIQYDRAFELELDVELH